jgi:hypothetical protein
MIPLTSLWLAILLAGLAIFLLSFVCWMLMKHHYNDFGAVPEEEGFMDALRAAGAGAGQYRFPYCGTPEEMQDPDFQARYNAGPKGYLVLMPEGPFAMAAGMARTLLFCVAIAFAVAYVATIALGEGAASVDVFRLTATVTWLTCCGAHGWGAIWMGRSSSQTLKDVLDSLAYGLAVGAIFAWQWPG